MEKIKVNKDEMYNKIYNDFGNAIITPSGIDHASQFYDAVNAFFNGYEQTWDNNWKEGRIAAKMALDDLYWKIDNNIGYVYEADQLFKFLRIKIEYCFGY